MDDILKSIRDTAIARIKNPLLSTFILSWMIYNIKFFTVFALSDTSQRLSLIHDRVFNLSSDFLYPLYISLIYLFIIPLLNFTYEYIYGKLIEGPRNRVKQKNLSNYYYEIKNTTIAKFESSEEYIKLLKSKEVDAWVVEKLTIPKRIIELKEKLSDSQSKQESMRSGFVQELKDLNENNNDKTNQLEETIRLNNKNISNLKLQYKNMINEISTTMNKIAAVNEKSGIYYDLKQPTHITNKMPDEPIKNYLIAINSAYIEMKEFIINNQYPSNI